MASRRLNGEGCLYRVNGRYYYKQRLKRRDGTVEKIHFPCGRTGKGALEEIERQRKRRNIGIDAKITFSAWLDLWLENYQADKAESTKKLYSMMIKKHVKPILGFMGLAELKPGNFAALFTLASQKLKPRTVNLLRSILNAVFNQAIDNELIYRNPVKGVKVPRIEPAKHRILSKYEFNLLFEKCLESEFKFPCLFMLFAGVRRGEALGINWSDINLENKTVFIHRQVIDDCGSAKACPLKTGKSYRTIAIPEAIVKELEAIPPSKRQGYLYCRQRLGNPRRLTELLKRFALAAGIEPVRSHDLRHTHASILLKDKVSLPAVSARLGHASTRITGDIYAHEIPGSQDEAVLTLDRFVRSAEVASPE